MEPLRKIILTGGLDRVISKELRENDVLVSDSNYKESLKTIWNEFAHKSNEHYFISGYEEYGHDAPSWCGLCGHEIHIGYYASLRHDCPRLVTRHPELGCEIQWPATIRMGSTCVEQLGLDSSCTRFYRKYFRPGTYNHEYKTGVHTDEIRICALLRYYEDWNEDVVAAPLSLFARLPAIVEEQFLKYPAVLRKPFTSLERMSPSRLLKSMMRNSGKYKVVQRGLETVDRYRLCYLFHRLEAQKIYEFALKNHKSILSGSLSGTARDGQGR